MVNPSFYSSLQGLWLTVWWAFLLFGFLCVCVCVCVISSCLRQPCKSEWDAFLWRIQHDLISTADSHHAPIIVFFFFFLFLFLFLFSIFFLSVTVYSTVLLLSIMLLSRLRFFSTILNDLHTSEGRPYFFCVSSFLYRQKFVTSRHPKWHDLFSKETLVRFDATRWWCVMSSDSRIVSYVIQIKSPSSEPEFATQIHLSFFFLWLVLWRLRSNNPARQAAASVLFTFN